MLSLDGDLVMLELKDGRKVPVPLARLIAADAEHARNAGNGAHAAADGGAEEPNFTSEWPERIKFTEGLAQYVEMTPYRAGTFTVRGNIDYFIAHVTAFGKDRKGGRNLGRNIKLPRLREFMLQPYEAFRTNPALNYGSALLITCYFMHMDGEGDAKRLKAMLKAIRDGQDEEQALKVLLDGRSFEELEEELSKAWRRKGVEFAFG